MQAMTELSTASPSAPLRTEPSATERLSRNLSLALLLGLIALVAGRELAGGGSAWWTLKALPLLPALPGLWRYRLYTYRWLSLLVWLYVGDAALLLGETRGASLWSGVQLLVAVGLFASCSAHIRQRLAAAKAAQP